MVLNLCEDVKREKFRGDKIKISLSVTDYDISPYLTFKKTIS